MKAGMKASATGKRKLGLRYSLPSSMYGWAAGILLKARRPALRRSSASRKFLFSTALPRDSPGDRHWGGGVSFLVDGRNGQGYSRSHWIVL